jgi:hypothetical protein
VQVLQEFFVTVTKKVAQPLSIDDAAERLREFAAWKVFTPAAGDVLAAIALHKQARVWRCRSSSAQRTNEPLRRVID